MSKKPRGRTTAGRRKDEGTNGQCGGCVPAKCCMYFSIEIDEPEDAGDYDDLLWIIAHRDAEIYINDDRWYLLVRNPCRFYDAIKGCLIYPVRPRICRGHTTEECEFDEDYGFDFHFHSYEELQRFIDNNPLPPGQ